LLLCRDKDVGRFNEEVGGGSNMLPEEVGGGSNVLPPESITVSTKRANDGISSRKAKKKRKKASTKLLDEETERLFSNANSNSKEKFEEIVRHNRAMEELEKKKELREENKILLLEKQEDRNSWKGKNDELDYKVRLVTNYKNLQQSGMSTQQIMALFPEMKSVIDAFGNSNETDLAVNGNDDDGMTC
jgi:hypothetical protein